MAAHRRRSRGGGPTAGAASSSSSPTASGVKLGPNGAAFVSSGIPDLGRAPLIPRRAACSAQFLEGGIMSTSDRGASVSDEGLRIAWQYRKYFGDERTSGAKHRVDSKQEFSNDFDLRKRLERHLLNAQHIQCLRTQDVDTLSDL
ncbi:hypothetical protein QYE76_001069 [Lolium multiflorum]|uniref:Uncharacterized protein n=1 Tax=Lolium multiflorum TaxID=4521 RepID=A0AAD8RKL4_LOLMU|nr:hypothetical protein QYE76_001069 [Lolium multiflorum]